MKITTLVDNLVYPRNLLAEHGLSFYIEIAANKTLFDCGQSSIFAQNAYNLGIDLKEIENVIISHGHYDHTGGLEKFLEINKTAKIYVKKEALLEKFNHGRYIGMPKALFTNNSDRDLTNNNDRDLTNNSDRDLTNNSDRDLTNNNDRELTITRERVIFPTEQITQICDSVFLVSFQDNKNVPFKENENIPNKTTGFTIFQNEEHIKDYFNDEQYLVYINDNKISLVTGCSHRGILEIIALVKKLFNLPIYEIIGGLHTQKQSNEEIEALAQEFNKSSIQSLIINHCTGVDAFAILKSNFKGNVRYNYTGNHFKTTV